MLLLLLPFRCQLKFILLTVDLNLFDSQKIRRLTKKAKVEKKVEDFETSGAVESFPATEGKKPPPKSWIFSERDERKSRVWLRGRVRAIETLGLNQNRLPENSLFIHTHKSY